MRTEEEIQDHIDRLQGELESWQKYRDGFKFGEYNLDMVRICEQEATLRNEKLRLLRWVLGGKEGEK